MLWSPPVPCFCIKDEVGDDAGAARSYGAAILRSCHRLLGVKLPWIVDTRHVFRYSVSVEFILAGRSRRLSLPADWVRQRPFSN